MGIEVLSNRVYTISEIEKLIHEKKPREAWGAVHALALQFADKGREGVQSVDRYVEQRLSQKKGNLFPDEPLFANLPLNLKIKLRENWAGIVFGASMRTVETILGGDDFEPELFHAWISRYTSGTRLRYDSIRYDNNPASFKADLPKMFELENKDKTHSIFFSKEGLQALPGNFVTAIESTKSLRLIQDEIIPIHKKLVGASIPQLDPQFIRWAEQMQTA